MVGLLAGDASDLIMCFERVTEARTRLAYELLLSACILERWPHRVIVCGSAHSVAVMVPFLRL